MGRALNILLLAGSAEARQIARGLLDRGYRVEALVSEMPRGSVPMPMPFTLTDFTDFRPLVHRMKGFGAVLDASHGFDAAMTETGFAAARERGLPFLSLRRPGWSLMEDPLWQSVPDVAAAMPLVAAGTRVFAATGWNSLPDLAEFPGERLFLRQTTPHDRVSPYEYVETVFGQPPFTVETETALFRELAIDMLICRNLGGNPSRPKLDAARALGMGVILIDRPPLPAGVRQVAEVRDALAWVDAL